MKTAWPADKVERRKVASLVPYARNARTHSAEQVDQIAASIREFRYVRHSDVSKYEKEGWRIAGELGPPHCFYSVLMEFVDGGQ